jgi:hypothetical protein
MSLIGDFPQLLKHFKASGFFITQGLEQLLLQRHLARRRVDRGDK